MVPAVIPLLLVLLAVLIFDVPLKGSRIGLTHVLLHAHPDCCDVRHNDRGNNTRSDPPEKR